MTFPWQWIFVGDGERWTDIPDLPPAPSRPFEELWAQLQRPANDQLATLVVIGWSDDLLQAIAADRILASKQIALMLRRADLGPASAGLANWQGRPPIATVYEDRTMLLAALRPFAGAYDHVLVDPDPEIAASVIQGRQDNYFRMALSLERNLVDIGHVLDRANRVGESIPLDAWKDAYVGRAALCLAAGPSLDRHLDRIRAWQDHCVVVCVDLIAARLEAAGIRVDFAVNVDSAASLLQRCRRPVDPHTVLITELAGNPGYDDFFPRRSFTSASTGLEGRLLPRPMLYARGTNVGSATVGWAAYMGCSEILLAGHDLCFDDAAYYSSLVSDGDSHASNERKASPVRLIVPGNDGKPRLTNYEFKVGIDDLGMMISRMTKVRVYNLNAGTDLGAAIPHTDAVPVDWHPPGDGPCPRPGDPAPFGEIAEAASLRETTRVQIVALVERWRALRAEGLDGLACEAALVTDRSLDCAASLFTTFIQCHVAQLVRLRGNPGSGHIDALIAQTERLLDGLLEPWVACMHRLLDRTWKPGAHTPIPPAVEAWRQAISDQVPQPETGSDDQSAIPYIARCLRDLRRELPEAGVLPPLDEIDAVQVVMTLKGEVTPEAVLRCLAWCMLAGEPLAHIIVEARRHGLLAPDGLLPGPIFAGVASRELTALAALRRVQAGAGDVQTVHAAADWPPLWPALIRHLLSPREGKAGIALLAGVVREGRIAVDDEVGGLLIGLHPDVLEAIDLVEGAGGILREGVALAAARRMADIHDYGRAIEQALSIRPLSRHADPAFVLCCRCLAVCERIDDVQNLLQSLSSRRQAMRVMLAFLAERIGVHAAVIECARHADAVYPPMLLIEALQAASAPPPPPGQRAEVVRAFTVLLDQARQPTLHPGELAVLDLGTQAMHSLVTAWGN